MSLSCSIWILSKPDEQLILVLLYCLLAGVRYCCPFQLGFDPYFLSYWANGLPFLSLRHKYYKHSQHRERTSLLLLVQFVISFGTNFLQTGASLKKAHGSERDIVTYVCETTYAVSSRLDIFYRGNMQLYIVVSS